MSNTTIMDFILASIENEKHPLTKTEWTRIRNFGTTQEIQDAVRRMEDAGGYYNLR